MPNFSYQSVRFQLTVLARRFHQHGFQDNKPVVRRWPRRLAACAQLKARQVQIGIHLRQMAKLTDYFTLLSLIHI